MPACGRSTQTSRATPDFRRQISPRYSSDNICQPVGVRIWTPLANRKIEVSLLQATWNSTLRVGEYFCRRSSGTTLGSGAPPPRPPSCIFARSIRSGCGACDRSRDDSRNGTPIASPPRASDPLTIQLRRENVCKIPYLSVRLSSVHDVFARALG